MTRASHRAPRRVVARSKAAGAFHHGNLRDAALALAVREVDAHGDAALSLYQVARWLGVTGPALYRHFADRHALLRAVAQHGYEGFEERITRAYDGEVDPWRSLVAAGLAYVDFACEHPGWFRLQFHSAEKPQPDTRRAPPRYQERIKRALSESFAQTPGEVTSVYIGLWALVHGLATLIIEEKVGGSSRPARRELARTAIEMHVDAVRVLARQR